MTVSGLGEHAREITGLRQGSDCGPPGGRAGWGASANRSPCRSLSDVFVKARHVPIEGVALIPRWAEWEAAWLPADEERWQAWLADDEPPELAFYCPACAEREFAG
jgi:hypothetical protein